MGIPVGADRSRCVSTVRAYLHCSADWSDFVLDCFDKEAIISHVFRWAEVWRLPGWVVAGKRLCMLRVWKI